MILQFENPGTCLIVREYLDRSRSTVRRELMDRFRTLIEREVSFLDEENYPRQKLDLEVSVASA